MDAAVESGRNPRISTRYSLSVENTQADAGRDGPHLSRETKFSGANWDRKMFIFFCSADHEQGIHSLL